MIMRRMVEMVRHLLSLSGEVSSRFALEHQQGRCRGGPKPVCRVALAKATRCPIAAARSTARTVSFYAPSPLDARYLEFRCRITLVGGQPRVDCHPAGAVEQDRGIAAMYRANRVVDAAVEHTFEHGMGDVQLGKRYAEFLAMGGFAYRTCAAICPGKSGLERLPQVAALVSLRDFSRRPRLRTGQTLEPVRTSTRRNPTMR